MSLSKKVSGDLTPKWVKCRTCTNRFLTPECPTCRNEKHPVAGELERLTVEDGDFILIKGPDAMKSVQEFCATTPYPKAIVFLYAPEGLSKVTRGDLEQALQLIPEPPKPSKLILSPE